MNKGVDWSPNLLNQAVQKLVPALRSMDAGYDIDCRTLLPSKLDYSEGMHTGCHPALFKRVVRQPQFLEILKGVKSSLEDDFEMSRKNVAVLLCDVNGRHAAMAVGKALAECIAADQRFSLGTVHILTNQDTGNSCGVCARCEFWTRRWASRNIAVNAVKAVWIEQALEVILPD